MSEKLVNGKNKILYPLYHSSSITKLRIVHCVCFKIKVYISFLKMYYVLARRIGTDETLRDAIFHLDIHGLPNESFWNHQYAKETLP